MYLRIVTNVKTHDVSAAGYMQRLCNSLVLVGAAQCCICELGSKLEKGVKSSGTMPGWMKGLVESVMKPLSYCQGQNWSSCRLDEQVKSSPPKGKVKNVTPTLVEEEDYFVVDFSPNVLSLFLETRTDLALQKVYMMSPRVNNRHLHLARVWNGEGIKTAKDPGIIGTMLDLAVGKKAGDKSLSESYIIFPYVLWDEPNLDDPPVVYSEHVFSCQKRLNDATRIVVHPTINVFDRLLQILVTGVCMNCLYCVNKLMLFLRMFCFFLSFTACFRMRKMLVQMRMIAFLSCLTK
jgi:hypothetical protein